MRTAETHPKPRRGQPPRLSLLRGGGPKLLGAFGVFSALQGGWMGLGVPSPMLWPGLLHGAAHAGVTLALGFTAPRGMEVASDVSPWPCHRPWQSTAGGDLPGDLEAACAGDSSMSHLAACHELEGSQHLPGGSCHPCSRHTLSPVPGGARRAAPRGGATHEPAAP